MGSETRIEWADHTFNAWRGCSKVAGHPACDHCYAEAMSKRSPATLGTWGASGSRVVAAESYWQLPFRWNRQAIAAGRRATVFALSLGDVFEDWPGRMVSASQDADGERGAVLWWRSDIGVVGAGQTTIGHHRGERLATMDDVRDRLMAVIDETPALIWLLLTKRPERIRDCLGSQPRANVMFGTSASDQATLKTYGRRLLDAVGPSRAFLSLEPLVGPVDLVGAFEDGPLPAWIIAGGESGTKARPCHPDWTRTVQEQCATARVPFFWKQWGEWLPIDEFDFHRLGDAEKYESDNLLPNRLRGDAVTSDACRRLGTLPTTIYRVGKKLAGRTLDGKTYSERPAWFDAPIDTAREGCI